jgi:hypothetical protein
MIMPAAGLLVGIYRLAWKCSIAAGAPQSAVRISGPADAHSPLYRRQDHVKLTGPVRTHEVYRLKPALEYLLDVAERAEMAERCAGLDRTNGAEEASRAIVELAHIGRTDKAAGF